MEHLLSKTPLLDFEHPTIQALVDGRGWRKLPPYEAIGAAYDFVKNEIDFGYNSSDDIPASRVLADGYGQCNTKGTLLMSLLRAMEIPCRFHGFTIYNELQRGAIPNYIMPMAPRRIIHSWVEIYWEDRWVKLEGFIIDPAYLAQVQKAFCDRGSCFSGYGVATRQLDNPPVEWNGGDTYIQNAGIADDLGIYDNPDVFYRQYGANLKGIKRLAYKYLIRHLINRHVNILRRRGLSKRAVALTPYLSP